MGVIDVQEHFRAFSMTAAKFRSMAEAAGLCCIGQELINWGTKRPIDCISVFTVQGSAWAGPYRLIENRHFMDEAESLRKLSALYGLRRRQAEADPPS